MSYFPSSLAMYSDIFPEFLLLSYITFDGIPIVSETIYLLSMRYLSLSMLFLNTILPFSCSMYSPSVPYIYSVWDFPNKSPPVILLRTVEYLWNSLVRSVFMPLMLSDSPRVMRVSTDSYVCELAKIVFPLVCHWYLPLNCGNGKYPLSWQMVGHFLRQTLRRLHSCQHPPNPVFMVLLAE